MSHIDIPSGKIDQSHLLVIISSQFRLISVMLSEFNRKYLGAEAFEELSSLAGELGLGELAAGTASTSTRKSAHLPA